MTGQYNCMIIDDEELAIEVIENHLEKIPGFIVASKSSNPINAFDELTSKNIDVLFLDINMPEISGISMLEIMNNPPLTVFTTAHREYALEGYELDVVDYLLKPIGFKRFLKTINKLREKLQAQKLVGDKNLKEIDHIKTKKVILNNDPFIFLKTNRSFLKILLNEVIYIEAIRNHVKVVTEENSHIAFISISKIGEELLENFIRIHRSFIVNANFIIKFDKHTVTNKVTEIPIGRTYKDKALVSLRQFLL